MEDRHGDGSRVLTCRSSRSITADTLGAWVPGQALAVGLATAAGRAAARPVVGCPLCSTRYSNTRMSVCCSSWIIAENEMPVRTDQV